MKIVFSPDYWKRPANGLVAALQERLYELLEHAGEYGICDGKSLEDRMTSALEELSGKFPRSKADHIKMKVFREMKGAWETFTLNHRNDNIAHSAHVFLVFEDDGSWKPMPGPFGTIVVEVNPKKNER